MCHKMGIPPISIIGFGLNWLSSLMREPKPPASNTTFIGICFYLNIFFQINRVIFLADSPKVLITWYLKNFTFSG